MVADPRADALVSNFTGQWLQLRNIDKRVMPAILMFDDFDDNLRQAFRRETEMLFEHILREDAACSSCSTPTTRSSTSASRGTTAFPASTARASGR